MPIPSLSAIEGAFLVKASCRAVLRLTGKGLVKTLQDILSNDVEKIAGGSVATSLLLTPKGKPVAVFDVLGGDEAVEIVTDVESVEELTRELGRYARVARARLELADAVAMTLYGSKTVDTIEKAEAGLKGIHDSRGVVTILARPDAHIATEASLSKAGAVVVSREDFDRARVKAGVSWGGHEIVPEYFPQELGLGGLIDYKKGCFVGQETMARLKNFGHTNRELVGIEAASGTRVLVGAAVRVGGAQVGTTTSAIGGAALAVVRTGAAIEGLDVEIDAATNPVPFKVRTIAGIHE
ncbi:MAG: hypothetical protein HY556_08595 [Euryarchaeota archaeon]|nr:hypothetical protein [Euryarchaeota archaeon]